jgi:uncharacterized membrane protein YphA (DoxX/SURF4 family)
MSLIRRTARPLLATVYISGGLKAVRHPETLTKTADDVAQAITTRVPALPNDTESLVRLNGAVQLGAGLALATGKFRRLSALALVGSTVPTTLAAHRFWEETDPEVRAQQKAHFFKNLGLMGGLLLAAVDTEGAPSLTWRARRHAKRLNAAVHSVGNQASAVPLKDRVGAPLEATAPFLAAGANRVGTALAQGAGRSTELLAHGRELASQSADRGSELLAPVAGHAAEVLAQGAGRGGELLSHGLDLASQSASRGGERLAPVAGHAAGVLAHGAGRGSELLSQGVGRGGELVSYGLEHRRELAARGGARGGELLVSGGDLIGQEAQRAADLATAAKKRSGR